MMNRTKQSQSAFTMIEIAIVIAIVAIASGIGIAGFVRQINQSKVNSAVSIINSQLLQARQSAIATRETRRVVLYVGQLENFGSGELSGQRIDRGQIWVEGKRCEKFLFSDPAYCMDSSGRQSNIIELTEPVLIPDGVTIASIGNVIIGTDNNQTLYIEFNPRGQATKVYFAGDEDDNRANLATATELALHFIPDNEVFDVGTSERGYEDTVGNINLSNWAFGQEDNFSTERFKVNTIEIIRLTGKTRTYPYAIFGFWPSDEFIP